jgi:hypothetical protein
MSPKEGCPKMEIFALNGGSIGRLDDVGNGGTAVIG